MIYMKTGEKSILIIDPSNIQCLEQGKPLITPEKDFLVCYTPDLDWVREQLELTGMVKSMMLEPSKFDKILKESLKRPKVVT